MGKRRKIVLGILALLGVIVLAGGIFYFSIFLDFARAGFFEKQEDRTWTPETEKNLQTIQTALKLVHDSDGVYPKASEWMDKIKGRMRTEDLSQEDAFKKLIDPAAGGGEGVYGFAFNEAASEQYIDDLPQTGDTVLVFQSTNTEWNAAGDPAEIGRPGGRGITASGEIVELENAGS